MCNVSCVFSHDLKTLRKEDVQLCQFRKHNGTGFLCNCPFSKCPVLEELKKQADDTANRK